MLRPLRAGRFKSEARPSITARVQTTPVGASAKSLLLRLARLEEENAALRERVATLEERLGRNSQNSSPPPSQDPPFAPPSQ